MAIDICVQEEQVTVEVMLDAVKIPPTLQEKTATENGVVVADEGYDGLSKVNVSVSGGGSGGGAELNIHYGNSAPKDTSMLWCKCDSPSKVLVSSGLSVVGEQLNLSIGNLPTTLYDMGVGVVGTKVYLFGGHNGTSSLNTIYLYNGKSKTIEQLFVTLPEANYSMGVAVIGTKIYLMGGVGNPTAIYVFDTTNDTISTLSKTLPAGLYDMGVGVVGTMIYLFGGYSTTAGKRINTIYYFDTITNTIANKWSLPALLRGVGVGVVGTKIYTFGGSNGSGTTYICMLDTTTNTFTTLSVVLPKGIYDAGVGVVGNKIYIFGGVSRADIYIFDTETNTISTFAETFSTNMACMGVGVVGTEIYLFGGCYNSNYYDIINALLISSPLDKSKLLIEPTLTENIFNILNGDITMEMGVIGVYLGDSENNAKLVESYLYQNEKWVQI